MATGLAVWFLFFHTPPFWKHRHLLHTDRMLVVHIIAASAIYLACAHNCLCTPGGGHLQQHTGVGRVGMVSGIVSFVLGAWMLAGDCSGPELQALLRSHIGNMISLFAMACGIPAAIRLSEAVAPNETVAVFALIAIIVGFQTLASKYIGILGEL